MFTQPNHKDCINVFEKQFSFYISSLPCLEFFIGTIWRERQPSAFLGYLVPCAGAFCMKRSRSPSNDHSHEKATTGEESKAKKSRAEPAAQHHPSPSLSSSHHHFDTMEVVPVGSSDVPEEAKNIDLDLYSRQYYVYGGKAMTKMADSTVFLSGLGGLGVEIGTVQ
jgi:hypothetical protein